MKNLVLGSSGQIGTALVHHFRNKGEEVILFDIERDLNEDLRLPRCRPLIEKIEFADFVYFLAFDVGGSRYLKNYQHTYEFVSNNIRLMESTFQILKEFKKPFIFASSQMSNMSHSPYGVLKALGEAYTRSLGGLIVKFWNVYGLEHDLEKSHVITDFVIQALKNRSIHMLTDGTELRQFLHVDDCSASLDILANSYKKIDRNENLHITSFEWSSIKDVAKIISDEIGGVEIVASSLKDSVQLDKRNEPDGNVLKYWTPKISLKMGINSIIKQMSTKIKNKK